MRADTVGRVDPVPLEERIRMANDAVIKYGNPAGSMRMIAVTGTNGKSTTVHMVRSLLDADYSTASIGTLGVLKGIEGTVVPGGLGLTTPGPDELQRVLRNLADDKVTCVVMEVSSHALEQRRIHGIGFNTIAFTNFTRDHLDYHKTPEQYFSAKALLGEYIGKDGWAVVNMEDEAWTRLPHFDRTFRFNVEWTAEPVDTKGGKNFRSDLLARNVLVGPAGSSWQFEYAGESVDVQMPLLGNFNISNASCAASIALCNGVALKDIASRFSNMPQVAGRLEVIAERPTIIRDYAHTPDALERALKAIRAVSSGRIIVVFGAGGDRDKGKRPLMGRIAELFGDVAIITSDNPRTESPEEIIKDIQAGFKGGPHQSIVDRHDAIRAAINLAQPDDVILLAGKGHETYQVIGTERIPFDEKEIVQSIVSTV